MSMKYIYQKRTLHSFPDYLKLKSYMYLQLQIPRLSPLLRDLLVAATCKF